MACEQVKKKEELEEETRSVLEDVGVRQNGLWCYDRMCCECEDAGANAKRGHVQEFYNPCASCFTPLRAPRNVVHLSIQGTEK